MRTGIGFLSFILFSFSQTGMAVIDLPSDASCVYTQNSPKVVEFSESKACTSGKPRARFFCVGSVKCVRPKFEPLFTVVMCPMPEKGCLTDAGSALACAKATSPTFKVMDNNDIDLEEARVYQRSIVEEDRLQTRSKSTFKSSGLVHEDHI